MAGIIGSISIGYLLGNFNPAALIAAVKNIDLRKHGTRNLGATNVTLTLGLVQGIVVMIIDMLKAFLSVRVAKILYPGLSSAGALAGYFCILGHVFPILLRFRGGKGLAAFGGMLLALDPFMFLMLLLIGAFMVWITDYPIAMTFSAAVLAPVLTILRLGAGAFFMVLCASGLIIYKHWENVAGIKNGTEGRLRPYLRERVKKDQQ